MPEATLGLTRHSTTATHFIRKMQGQSQSHLLQADDGHCYVVKFRNNPQHRRVLVNELVASVLLRYLNVPTPRGVVVRISDEFLRENPDVYLQLPSTRRAVVSGYHYGSRYPVDIKRQSVYDFLPDQLLNRAVDLSPFLSAYVADKWLALSATRQAIFFRSPPETSPRSTALSPPGIVVQMIGQGSAFGGANWSFGDSPSSCLYFRPSVYHQVTSIDSFQPWLDEVACLPEHIIEEAREAVPDEWLEGDDARELETMLDEVLRRRDRVVDQIHLAAGQEVSPFPNWTNKSWSSDPAIRIPQAGWCNDDRANESSQKSGI